MALVFNHYDFVFHFNTHGYSMSVFVFVYVVRILRGNLEDRIWDAGYPFYILESADSELASSCP